MLPVKKILCPTDFSGPSFEAIKVASELALQFGSQLCLLHVVPPTPALTRPTESGAGDLSAYWKNLEESAQAKLKKVMNDLVSKELRTCQPVVLIGSAADEILRYARDEKIDLIVISTYGQTGWGHVVYGSVAHRIVQFAPCPVISIRPALATISPEEQKKAVEEVEKTVF